MKVDKILRDNLLDMLRTFNNAPCVQARRNENNEQFDDCSTCILAGCNSIMYADICNRMIMAHDELERMFTSTLDQYQDNEVKRAEEQARWEAELKAMESTTTQIIGTTQINREPIENVNWFITAPINREQFDVAMNEEMHVTANAPIVQPRTNTLEVDARNIRRR